MLEVQRTADRSRSTRSKAETARDNADGRASEPAESSPDKALDHDYLRAVAPVEVKSSIQIPVITGEAHFAGIMNVEGLMLGKLGEQHSGLHVRQTKRSGLLASQPELSGLLSFKELVRINGHIAGTVYSESGTLIVDSDAAVDANVKVGIAVIKGTVNGDIVAQRRVELGPGARVFGNIWTRSIAIEAGATFDGECTMLLDD